MRLRIASPLLKDRARSLRHGSTEAEALLWHHLRNRNLGGASFRRQRPIGPYIVDFYNPEYGLVIEVDGEHHATGEQPEQDKERTAYLIRQGLHVRRFTNTEVLLETD